MTYGLATSLSPSPFFSTSCCSAAAAGALLSILASLNIDSIPDNSSSPFGDNIILPSVTSFSSYFVSALFFFASSSRNLCRARILASTLSSLLAVSNDVFSAIAFSSGHSTAPGITRCNFSGVGCTSQPLLPLPEASTVILFGGRFSKPNIIPSPSTPELRSCCLMCCVPFVSIVITLIPSPYD